MLVEVLERIDTRKGPLHPGRHVDIPASVVMRLRDKVRVLSPPEAISDTATIEDGELKLLSPVDNLAAVIVGLTQNDLKLQKQMLIRHCQQYAPETHFWKLKEMWEERAAILEYDGGLTRHEAELEAAKMYHLLAFLDDLKGETHGENATF